MKKINKKILGVTCLVVVVAMTIMAIFTPDPNTSALEDNPVADKK